MLPKNLTKGTLLLSLWHQNRLHSMDSHRTEISEDLWAQAGRKNLCAFPQHSLSYRLLFPPLAPSRSWILLPNPKLTQTTYEGKSWLCHCQPGAGSCPAATFMEVPDINKVVACVGVNPLLQNESYLVPGISIFVTHQQELKCSKVPSIF